MVATAANDRGDQRQKINRKNLPEFFAINSTLHESYHLLRPQVFLRRTLGKFPHPTMKVSVRH